MNDDVREASQSLLVAIDVLETVEGCEVIDVDEFNSDGYAWGIRIKLNIDSCSEYVPKETSWYICVEDGYPYGSIAIYPDIYNSIISTFPHQSRNEEGDSQKPWREGKLCLDVPIKGAALLWSTYDPVGNSDFRLKWHVERALSWLDAAANDRLLNIGDRFELPEYPLPKEGSFRIVHNENKVSYKEWLSRVETMGRVVFDVLDDNKTLLAVAFEDINNNIIYKTSNYSEDRNSSTNDKRQTGIWWKWASPIIMEPWETPTTWGDLESIGKSQGIDIYAQLRFVGRIIRQEHIRVLMLGYPIPSIVGSSPVEIHWKAIELPTLAPKKRKKKGSFTEESGWWRHIKKTQFSSDIKLKYLITENWHEDRLQARGRFDRSLRDLKIALIGCGAIGSMVAECLARGGVKSLLLIDNDILQAGNIVRHSLTLHETGKYKVNALKDHLSSINPHMVITPYDKSFPVTKGSVEELLETIDLVIDCTASRSVLETLALGWWSKPRAFVSLAVGHEAKRMFLFITDGQVFPIETFKELTDPWRQCELNKYSRSEAIIEGAGCWSPVFPARFDDISMVASIASRIFEHSISKRPCKTDFMVYEQQMDIYGVNSYKPLQLTHEE